MPMFPETWMDELLQKTDLASLVSEYVPLSQKSGRLWGCCPFHNEKTPSFPFSRTSRCIIALGAMQAVEPFNLCGKSRSSPLWMR